MTSLHDVPVGLLCSRPTKPNRTLTFPQQYHSCAYKLPNQIPQNVTNLYSITESCCKTSGDYTAIPEYCVTGELNVACIFGYASLGLSVKFKDNHAVIPNSNNRLKRGVQQVSNLFLIVCNSFIDLFFSLYERNRTTSFK
jgi:hypothetical protein